MKREHIRNDEDERDVLDNPEWSEADIRARHSLAHFAPELAGNINRALTKSARPKMHLAQRESLEPQAENVNPKN